MKTTLSNKHNCSFIVKCHHRVMAAGKHYRLWFRVFRICIYHQNRITRRADLRRFQGNRHKSNNRSVTVALIKKCYSLYTSRCRSYQGHIIETKTQREGLKRPTVSMFDCVHRVLFSHGVQRRDYGFMVLQFPRIPETPY